MKNHTEEPRRKGPLVMGGAVPARGRRYFFPDLSQFDPDRFTLQVKPSPPKRWTLEELRRLFEKWHEDNGEECEDCHSVDDFFRWLGRRDG